MSATSTASAWSWVTNTVVTVGLVVQLRSKRAHLGPQGRVELGERLVQQQHPRLEHQRPGQGDPLLLPAGQLADPALGRGRRAAPGRASASTGRARIALRAGRASAGRTPTLSSTVRCGNSNGFWNTNPTGRRSAGTGQELCPSKQMSPVSGAVRPASIDRVVLLPHPDGPSSAVNEPARQVQAQVIDRGGLAEATSGQARSG